MMSAAWVVLAALLVGGAVLRRATPAPPAGATDDGAGLGRGQRASYSAELHGTSPVLGAAADDAGSGSAAATAGVAPWRSPLSSVRHRQQQHHQEHPHHHVQGKQQQGRQRRRKNHHNRYHHPEQGQEHEEQGRRRLQPATSSCSAHSEYAPSTLADPDIPEDNPPSTYEFRCADGEFLVEAEPSVIDHTYTQRRSTYSVRLIQYISWTCSDGQQSELPGSSLDFYTDASSTSPTAAGAGVASFTAAITGVTARYLPYPDCASLSRGGVVTDAARCYHFGAMSFSGHDTLAGGGRTVGTFGDDAYFSDAEGAIDTYSECADDSYASGFLMAADGTGLVELRLVCAEFIAGVCEPPGFNPETPAPTAITTTPSPSGGQSNNGAGSAGGGGGDGSGGSGSGSGESQDSTTTDGYNDDGYDGYDDEGDDGSENSGSSWPPSWWIDSDQSGAMLIAGGIGGVMALGLCCHLLRFCVRKVCCCFGFTDYDGNWGEVENGQGDDGGGGVPEAAGVAGTSEAGGGDGRAGYGRVRVGYGGTGGSGGGVDGNWGGASCNNTATGDYRYGAPGAAAAAAASPSGHFSPTFGNGHHRVTPVNTPGNPSGGGGYYHANSRPVSPSAVSPSSGYGGGVPAGSGDGFLSPPRLETPTAPARDDIEDQQLQEAVAASRQQRVGGGTAAEGAGLPVAVPVPD